MAKAGYRIKSKGNSESSLYVNFRPIGGGVFETRTGLMVFPVNWSQSKQRLKGKDPHTAKFNSVLDALNIHIVNSYNEDVFDGKVISLAWFKTCVKTFFNDPINIDAQSVSDYIQMFNDKLKVSNRDGVGLKKTTIRSYENFGAIVLEYEKSRESSLRFEALTKDVFEDFFRWLISSKNYKLNYALRVITRLKTICKEATIEGVKVHNHFSLHKPKAVNHQRYFQVLNEEEIAKIKSFQPKEPHLINTRKWMLIGLYIGQRVSDLLTIMPANVTVDNEEVYINITQLKTGKHITAGIKDTVVVDIILNDFPKPMSSALFNRYIKLVCRGAGIDSEVMGYKQLNGRKVLVEGEKYEFVTAHDFRRSFATNYFYKGIPVSVLMNITGHSKESTFFEYIGHKYDKVHHAKTFLSYL
jgi:integrase